jgi:hypothetical protein
MVHNPAMPLNVGDKVRSNDGQEGAIIFISAAGTAATVLLHGDVEAALAVSIGLDQLKAINAY